MVQDKTAESLGRCQLDSTAFAIEGSGAAHKQQGLKQDGQAPHLVIWQMQQPDSESHCMSVERDAGRRVFVLLQLA